MFNHIHSKTVEFKKHNKLAKFNNKLNNKSSKSTEFFPHYFIPKKKGDIPPGLGLNKKIAQKIIKALKKHSKNGILTILEINPAAQMIHYLWLEGKFKAMLKPIYIKRKTAKNSLLATFIPNPIKSRMLGKYNLQPIDLKYPLEHLWFLHEKVKYIKILKIENGILKIQDELSPAKSKYIIKIKGLNVKKLNINRLQDFFKSNFYKNNKTAMITVCDEQLKPIKVQGVKINNKCIPIITDIDTHNLGEQLNNDINAPSNNTAFHTTYKNHNRTDKIIQLKQNLIREIENSSPSLRDLKISNNIPKTMGTISAREFLIDYYINKEFNQILIQHGSTSTFPSTNPHLIPKNTFPSIEDNKIYGAIFASGHVISLYSKTILAFYHIMRSYNYNFTIHPSWQDDMNNLLINNKAEIEMLRKDLQGANLIKKVEPYPCKSIYQTSYKNYFNKNLLYKRKNQQNKMTLITKTNPYGLWNKKSKKKDGQNPKSIVEYFKRSKKNKRFKITKTYKIFTHHQHNYMRKMN
ncbi:MAG: hypothetical protein PVI75_02880 [Gammaproteobacteria bacterium]|jgi:hypothetical protein